MCGMHKNPINCLLHLIAGVIIIYALWVHSITWIIIGIVIALVGHIIQALSSGKPRGKEKKTKKLGNKNKLLKTKNEEFDKK